MESTKLTLLLADAQLLGFSYASKGYSVKELAKDMDLTRDEWLKLRDKSFLKPLDKEELDKMFEIKNKS